MRGSLTGRVVRFIGTRAGTRGRADGGGHGTVAADDGRDAVAAGAGEARGRDGVCAGRHRRVSRRKGLAGVFA